MADGTTTENRREKWGEKKFPLLSQISCTHTRNTQKTKPAIRLGIQQRVRSAMVTMCACYKGPSVSAFLGRGVGVGRLNGSFPGYLCLPIRTGDNRKNIHKASAEIAYLVRTKHCRLTVNIICNGSSRGTPFIPNHLKLGPSDKIRLRQLFSLTTHSYQAAYLESFKRDKKVKQQFHWAKTCYLTNTF